MEELKNTEELAIYENIKLGRLYRKESNYDSSVKEFKTALSKILPQENPFLHNIALNEIEISEGSSILKSKPRGLGIALTNRCNIRCIMCSVWKNPWDIPEKTVKELAGFLPYLQRLFWQGGEVFLSPYFEGLFDKVTSYPHIRQDINTNGLLIDKKWAEKLIKANANIILSIDGITKETYEHIRRGARFEDLLKSIELLNESMDNNGQDITDKRRKSSTIINLVVMKSNYRELGDYIDFAKKYRFDRLQITPVDLKASENIFRNRDKDALAYIEKIMPEVLMKAKDYGINVSNWLPSLEKYVSPKPPDEPEKGAGCPVTGNSTKKVNGRVPCYWPWQFLFIDWGGRVRPQCFCLKALGNIHEDTIEGIWNNNIIQTYRQKIVKNDIENWCDDRCVSGDISDESLSLD